MGGAGRAGPGAAGLGVGLGGWGWLQGAADGPEGGLGVLGGAVGLGYWLGIGLGFLPTRLMKIRN